MKNKIINYINLIFAIVVFSTKINGQISKGDFILDFSSWAYLSKGTLNKPLGNFEATYMIMISNKFMIGGELYYNHNFLNEVNTSGEWEYYPFNSYRISPTIRYYFTNKKLAPFATLKNDLSLTKFEKEEPWENNNGYRGIVGVGVNYFLGNNIALEGLITSNLISLGGFKDESKHISLSTGIKLFFNSQLQNNMESLPEKILKKGNFETSGNFINFRHSPKGSPTSSFHFSPDIRYFITDRFNIYGNYSFHESRLKSSNWYEMNFGLGAEYYFRFNDNLYLNLGITGILELDTRHLNEIFKNSYRTLDIPISTSLNYFHNQKRMYLGIRYRYFELKALNRKITINERNTFSLFVGLDYFVKENIYFKGEFDFSSRNSSNIMNQVNSGALTLGVGFIIDSNKIEERAK